MREGEEKREGKEGRKTRMLLRKNHPNNHGFQLLKSQKGADLGLEKSLRTWDSSSIKTERTVSVLRHMEVEIEIKTLACVSKEKS